MDEHTLEHRSSWARSVTGNRNQRDDDRAHGVTTWGGCSCLPHEELDERAQLHNDAQASARPQELHDPTNLGRARSVGRLRTTPGGHRRIQRGSQVDQARHLHDADAILPQPLLQCRDHLPRQCARRGWHGRGASRWHGDRSRHHNKDCPDDRNHLWVLCREGIRACDEYRCVATTAGDLRLDHIRVRLRGGVQGMHDPEGAHGTRSRHLDQRTAGEGLTGCRWGGSSHPHMGGVVRKVHRWIR
mmetsp:Transcript_87098/g.173982  ORF Transcript_87098/g.173982 Transcript_87098/m.173982 type:complete len:244 (+) Transcript_87098:1743-2474(+)